MTLFQSDREATPVAPWLISALLLLCLPASAPAQVIDDFEAGIFGLVHTSLDFSSQTSLPPIHCIAPVRDVAIRVNGSLSTADLALTSVDNEVVMVWGDLGGRLELDYHPVATDLTSGGSYNALRVSLTVAVPAGTLEIVLSDGSGVSFLVSQPIVGKGDYVFPLADFIGVDVLSIEIIELNLEAPDFGDYHISDFRATYNSLAGAVIDVTQDTAEGPPYPSPPVEMTVFQDRPADPPLPLEMLEVFLFDVTNDGAPPPEQMMAMDSGGGAGMPGAQVAIAVTDLGADPPGHRVFDLHVHAASVGPTTAILREIPAITQPPTEVMPTNFSLAFTTYQRDSDAGELRRVDHWLSFETPDGSGLSFSNLRLMLGDPETHPNSFHVFFDVDTNGGMARVRRAAPMFDMLLRAEVFDYGTSTAVNPWTGSASLSLWAQPNVMGESTQLWMSRSMTRDVRLGLFNMAGRMVQTLTVPAGQEFTVWNGRDQHGVPVASGMYLMRAVDGTNSETAKIVKVR